MTNTNTAAATVKPSWISVEAFRNAGMYQAMSDVCADLKVAGLDMSNANIRTECEVRASMLDAMRGTGPRVWAGNYRAVIANLASS